MLGGCLHPVWVHLPRAAGCEPQNTPQRHAEPPARHRAREQEKPAVHQCPIHPSGLGGPQGGARLLLPPLLHAASSSTLRFHPTSQGRPPWAPHPQWVGHPGTPRVPQGAQVVPCPAAGLGRRETLSQERRHKEPMLRWVAFVGFVFFFLSLVFFFSSIHFFMKTAPRVLRPTGCQKETEQKTKTKDKKNLALLSSRLSEISSCSIEGSGF